MASAKKKQTTNTKNTHTKNICQATAKNAIMGILGSFTMTKEGGAWRGGTSREGGGTDRGGGRGGGGVLGTDRGRGGNH